MGRRIAALAGRLELPPQFSGAAVNRIEEAIVAREVDGGVRNGGGGGDAPVRCKGPSLCPGVQIGGVELAVGAPEINRVSNDRWGGHDLAGRLELPSNT